MPASGWFVPVAYEAAPQLSLAAPPCKCNWAKQPETRTRPASPAATTLRPDEGFIGRDETIHALDRAFDEHHVVLLHAYAGQGKTSTAVECRAFGTLLRVGWGARPLVLFASFESHNDLGGLA